jgi:hypothetical protein
MNPQQDLWAGADPGAAARARRSLGVLLRDLPTPGDRDRYFQSCLTMPGSPVEIAFATHDPALRYTIEPGPAELDRRARVDHAVGLLADLGAPTPPVDLLAQIRRWQAVGELRYGAHLGARHTAVEDRYKLYAELPREAGASAEPVIEDLLGSAAVLTGPERGAHLCLLGLDLASSALEAYYRVNALHPREIAPLMARIGLDHRAAELLDVLQSCTSTRLRHRLPGDAWGFSYAASAGAKQAPVFTLYTLARTLFGPDHWSREGVLGLAGRMGWDLGAYAEVSAPLLNRRRFVSYHGMFGLVIRPDAPLGAWIGLAPPESP